MLIHAHKRKEATPVDTGNATIQFEINDSGHAVADVTDEADIEVLLGIPEAFELYKPEAAATKATKTATAATGKSFLLKGKDGADDLDLATMGEKDLISFAKANGVNPHHSWKGENLDKLRQKLVDTFTE